MTCFQTCCIRQADRHLQTHVICSLGKCTGLHVIKYSFEINSNNMTGCIGMLLTKTCENEFQSCYVSSTLM